MGVDVNLLIVGDHFDKLAEPLLTALGSVQVKELPCARLAGRTSCQFEPKFDGNQLSDSERSDLSENNFPKKCAH